MKSATFLLLCSCLLACESSQRKILTLDGTAGMKVSGICVVIKSGSSNSYGLAIQLPAKVEYDGDIVSCSIQKQQRSGFLKADLSSGERHIAEGITEADYGMVVVAGR